MKQNIRLLGAVLCVFFVGAIPLFAGAAQEGGQSSTAEKMKIVMWDWHTPRMDGLRPMAEEYQKLNPHIEFETMVMPADEYWKKVLASSVSRDFAVDIFQIANQRIAELSNYITPYPEDMFPMAQLKEEYPAIDILLYNDKLYMFPLGIMSSAIYYNADMWDDAGLGARPKTWDELREAAVQLTQYEGDNVHVAGFGFTGDGYMQFIWGDMLYQKGGWYYNEDGTKVDDSWIQSPGVEALEYLNDMVFEDRVTEPGFLGFLEAFGTDRAAMVYAWTWFTGFLNTTHPDKNYYVSALPTFTGSPLPAVARNDPSSLSSVISSDEDKIPEIFKFLKWAFDDDDYLINMNITQSVIPMKKELLKDPRIADNPVISELIKVSSYTVYLGEYTECHRPVMANIEARIFQGMSAQETMEIVKAEIDVCLEDTPTTWVVERRYQPGL
jgi:multiple sugar transport system substrate-binding protein